MQSIYQTAKDQFLDNLEQSNKLLTPYEMFDLFLSTLTKHNKDSFIEDVKDNLKNEGYMIFKPRNLQEEIKLEEFQESFYPLLNERLFI